VIKCKSGIRSAAFHPSGDMFAVGEEDGKVEFFDAQTLDLKLAKVYRSDIVECMAFSPDGKYLAIGAWDQMVDIIDATNYKLLRTLKGHSSTILQLTFSADSKYLVTNTKDYEVTFFSVATGKRVNDHEVADVEWSQWLCTFGWPVVGIFQEGMDGTDVNSASVSGDSKSQYRVIAAGDDNQHVCLYRYPAITPKAQGATFVGHSSHVTRVRFSPDGSQLFSTGGRDESVIQWKHTMNTGHSAGATHSASSGAEEDFEV